jgi:uncharacterized membrane protein (DUF485 family)
MNSFWDFFWLLLCSFFFVMYLMLLFQLLKDLFSDPELSALTKVLWLIGFLVFPFLVALIYIGVRGKAMVERRNAELRRAQGLPDRPSATGGADDIAAAKKLLDEGTITQQEFDSLKSKALA